MREALPDIDKHIADLQMQIETIENTELTADKIMNDVL